jgi:replicative DNA helicase
MFTKTLPEYFDEAKKIIKEQRERGAPEFPTGLTFLDNMTGGMKRGEIWIISGKTGAGKTSLALQMARAFADNPEHTIAFFSLEMRGWQLCLRMYCEMYEASYFDLVNGLIAIDEKTADIFKDYISNIDFEVVEGGYLFEDIEKTIQTYYETKHPDIIFLDFVQLVEWKGYGDERVALMEYIRKIKEMANKMDVGFVVVSQIRRLPSGADYNRPPDLQDLKGSGSLEQMADKVLFLYKTVEEDSMKMIYEQHFINIAKNRQGKMGTSQVIFDGQFYKFKDPPLQQP